MDKIKFGRLEVGMRGLPPGFRFEPTEEELVFEYLKCKVLCCELPASIIPEINICNYDPWDLPGGRDWEEERYLFSKKLVVESGKGSTGIRRTTPTPSGYWKAKGCERKIVSSSSSRSNVGMKKTLAFYTNTNTSSSTRGCRTGWVMHEYRLISTDQPQSPSSQTLFNNNNNNNNMDEKWVLCHIFFKKHHQQQQPHYNSINSDSVSSTASSCSTTSNNSFAEFTSSTPLQQNPDHHYSAS